MFPRVSLEIVTLVVHLFHICLFHTHLFGIILYIHSALRRCDRLVILVGSVDIVAVEHACRNLISARHRSRIAVERRTPPSHDERPLVDQRKLGNALAGEVAPRRAPLLSDVLDYRAGTAEKKFITK